MAFGMEIEMTDSTQPEALRLAGLLELAPEDGVEPQTTEDAAAELRRQHTENTALQQGYAAAQLEIESLQARIKTMAEEHADELMVAHLDGMRAAQQEAQEPVAWYVTGCSRLLDEAEAKAEARHIGGTARAMPLYTAPQPSPKADSQPAPANTRQIAECYGDCPTDPKTCANQCKFEGRAARATADSVLEDADPLQGAANWLVKAHSGLETSTLAGKLSIGYNRAKRLHDAAIAARKQGGAA